MATPGTTLDLSPVDFCGKQVMSFAETFWTETFNNPAINELVTVIPGVKAKQQLVILGLIGLVGKTKTLGQCAPDASNKKISSIQKFYEPNQIEDRFINCWKDLLADFTVWGLKNNIQKPDLTGTDFANFLEERVIAGLVQSVYRFAWFGDTAITLAQLSPNDEDGLPMDVRYFNAIDGYWKRFKGIAVEYPAHYAAIPNNAGASYAAQRFTAADTTNQLITGVLQGMIDNADTRLSEDETATFYVTKSVYDQYKRERKAFPYIDLAYARTESGLDSLEIDGVRIVKLAFQDRFIQTYFNNGTKLDNPHRIYMTTKLNLHLPVEEEGSMTDVEAFYDQRDKLYYIDMLYSIGTQVAEDYKVMLAY
jgi:hypothetical protein